LKDRQVNTALARKKRRRSGCEVVAAPIGPVVARSSASRVAGLRGPAAVIMICLSVVVRHGRMLPLGDAGQRVDDRSHALYGHEDQQSRHETAAQA